jgi:hypothetical protein
MADQVVPDPSLAVEQGGVENEQGVLTSPTVEDRLK